MTIITRPTDTLTKRYVAAKKTIMRWKANNTEKLREYNKEYQRKLRADPERMEEIRDRSGFRSYTTGWWKNSYKFDSKVGMTREQLFKREGCKTMEEWKEFLKTHECDHIISASWFRKPENKYLKHYLYRHYNLQFVPRGVNRSKHNWIDESDPRIKLIISLMKMDYYMSVTDLSKKNLDTVEDLSREITRNKKAVIKKYGSL